MFWCVAFFTPRWFERYTTCYYRQSLRSIKYHIDFRNIMSENSFGTLLHLQGFHVQCVWVSLKTMVSFSESKAGNCNVENSRSFVTDSPRGWFGKRTCRGLSRQQCMPNWDIKNIWSTSQFLPSRKEISPECGCFFDNCHFYADNCANYRSAVVKLSLILRYFLQYRKHNITKQPATKSSSLVCFLNWFHPEIP